MVTQACGKNQISVNGVVSRASKEVFMGDTIAFRKDQITMNLPFVDKTKTNLK